jgi:3-hydroxyisobutyrate dehydrogenase
MSNIAWIGLGNMGLPMASHLVNAGFTVRGFEVSPAAADAGRAAGIEIYRTATEAVQEAQTVFTMLPNGRIVEQVLTGPDGVFAHVAAGTLVVDSSTIGIATCRKLHQAAQPVGIDYLDAPVSGGVEGAQAGTLTFMVGSEGAVFTRVRPLLDVMGHNIVHVGPVGAGLAAKIVNNMVLGVNLSAVCEAVTLGEHLGLRPRALYDIVNTSTGSSWVWDHWYPVEGAAENAPSDHGYRRHRRIGNRCSTCSRPMGWTRGWSTPAMSNICPVDRRPMCSTQCGCARWPSGRCCGPVSCRHGRSGGCGI